jgi:hypothetical protein
LVGVELQFIEYTTTSVAGYVASTGAHNFRFPPDDYNPYKDAKQCKMKECADDEEVHSITPYLPPENEQLYEKYRGLRIEISSTKGDK